MPREYSEDILIEQPTIDLFSDLHWTTANCFDETFRPGGGSFGRETSTEVILIPRLRAALQDLNPGVPAEAINPAIDEIIRDRSMMSLVNANREVFGLIRDGVKVNYKNDERIQVDETLRVIDWNIPENNDYFLASQFWITGDLYKRRTDLIGFVNGLPLVFIELKASHKDLKRAYEDNLRDYRSAIPQLFWYNAFIILSNGSKSLIGTISSEWEHFTDWKRINSEGETGIISLETMIAGTCDRDRLLDIIENFTIYFEAKGGIIKILAKNHQFLGVNNAISALNEIKKNQRKLGVFWHTQGSGKSYSMIFFAQKVLRKLTGNWTFLVVTDRIELDEQIYNNFVHSGAINEPKARAESGIDLQRLLSEDHRYVFTLIQKFRSDPFTSYPALSTREDIIVIADEAHRTQYDTLALNMRTALPNAAFIAFTGTPLIQTEEKTREVFGEYVSIYTYRQSTEDGATVPLYYENRIPELQITNQNLNAEIEQVIEEAVLSPEEEKRLEREFARDYHLITRNERLDRVAEDIVSHFTGRGWQGKGMVVSIDKATAVRMYDKVRKHWDLELNRLRAERFKATGEELILLNEKIELMEWTDMGVVVSQSQNEIEDLQKKGIDILPHRTRMVYEDLAEKFKDPKDPFRLVFVCAMWLTGFDAPACSTIYLDKPMKNHTLMQTIARANRVFGEKVNGLIVDYYGVFKNLEHALAIYAPGLGTDDTMPVQDKQALVGHLKTCIDDITAFCSLKGIDITRLLQAGKFEKVKLIDDAVEAILIDDESKQKFLGLTAVMTRLFKAIKPDPVVTELLPICTLYLVMVMKIRSLDPAVDISRLMASIEELLDRSISSEGYVIKTPTILDLSQINLDILAEKLKKGKKRTEAERLKKLLEQRVRKMVEVNRTRIDFLERLEKMIAEYNAGSHNIDEFFKKLLEFTNELNEEDKRALKENLTEEELTIFDLLTKPDMRLTKAQVVEVKNVAKELLDTLKRDKLVLDWRKKQQTRAMVHVCIEETLDHLPPVYEKEIFNKKCEIVYQYVYDMYPDAAVGATG
ncbi:MAG TPA: type I restriction endonuclease subunit R [Methanospirillum sp.]|nr:type I restriction endonuclease subunit R [Methanospirillum sp.]